MSTSRYILDARTATAHFPGIGRYTRNLAMALAPLLATDETLLILWNPTDPTAWNPSLLTDLPVIAIPAPASPFSLGQQWQMPRLLRKVSQGHQPSVPIYHSTYYLMPYYSGMPTLLTLYDLIAMLHPQAVSPRARLFFRMATRLALWGASTIIVISEATRRDLLYHFPVAAERVTTIPLAADPRFQPQPIAVVSAARQKYNLPDRYLFYLGINKPHKNLERLVAAYAQLSPPPMSGSRIPLVIAGAWDDRYPEAKQLVHRLSLEDAVRFLGPVADVDLPALYSGCTLFVFPSVYEGFGLPVVEAMACGAPVACSNVSSLPEAAGDAALLFDPFDVHAIAHALRRGLEDTGLRGSLAERSLQQASSFSWQRTAQETLSLYRRLRR